MATKKQVRDAYYYGVCDALMSAELFHNINLNTLEVDLDELLQFLDENPGLYDELRGELVQAMQ
jgi:hypothetical protein